MFLNLNATEKKQLIKVTFVGRFPHSNMVPGSLTHEHYIFMIINYVHVRSQGAWQ